MDLHILTDLFEALTIFCFGLSWPFNIAKSLRSRTAKGKSMLFESLVIVGYLCGLAGKFIGGNVTYVVAVYLVDIAMVTTDLLLTIRNAKLDQEREKAL